MAFGLTAYPVSYRAHFQDKSWNEEYLEKAPITGAEEARLSAEEREAIYRERNSYPDMPLTSYTTQYGLAVFEGLKALPQKDGGLAIFRPDCNARRFCNSMRGIYMPAFPEDMFVKAVLETVRRNQKMGHTLAYDPLWGKDHFLSAASLYIRPYAYSEGGIGVNISREPWVIIQCSPVTAYFSPGLDGAVVSERIRATPNGTGALKVA
ncbi:MAG: branched chain amino acid aminotransferase, partial [Spirochaetaceae bacterium]|nr:branched chain amino acid aminotransferase [Spirochaetaceae bacterium]